MHRIITFIASLFCMVALATAAVPEAKTTPTKTTTTASTPSYATLANAVTAGSQAPQLTSLFAAIKAAGVASALKADTKWTILAPNNAAFEKTLSKLNLTADALLKNKELVVKVLSYHVIPSGAVLSSQLKNNTEVATALKGAAPLIVKIYEGSVVFQGAVNKAKVVAPDIKAADTVIHVVDSVLVPPGIVSEAVAKQWEVQPEKTKAATKPAGTATAAAASDKKVSKQAP
nr:ScosAstaP [Enallax costatus]BCN28337.1 astaxanthin binding fasciclin family protein [Enallax costatus]